MVPKLPIPKSFGAAEAAAWFQAWRPVGSEPVLELVLPSGAFVRPAGVSLLASSLAERQLEGLETHLIAEPGSEDALRYLQRIDFFDVLKVRIEEGFERHDPAGRFVPLRRIIDEKTAQELANASAECLSSQLPDAPSSPLRMARFVFEELGVNIVQHSEAPRTGFGVLQSYAQGLEIAFADRGIGFLASLQKNDELAGRLEDEAEALQLAVGKGLTGTSAPRRNMGMGLGLLQDFADRLDGDLRIASGDALLHRRTVAGVRTTTVRSVEAWKGSWICLEAPLRTA